MPSVSLSILVVLKLRITSQFSELTLGRFLRPFLKFGVLLYVGAPTLEVK